MVLKCNMKETEELMYHLSRHKYENIEPKIFAMLKMPENYYKNGPQCCVCVNVKGSQL